MIDKKKTIESLLFVADRPLSKQEIVKLTETNKQETEKCLKQLIEEYNQEPGRGIQIINNQNDYQMVTHPQSSKIIQRFLKKEINSELSRPALETLAIISYRGPINKLELDQIRGVNCALILRNLMIRGLVEKRLSKGKENNEFYQVSIDFIQHLGINQLKDLPDYEKLSNLSLDEEEK
ncbi:MAG: SMC-Scp complex subunit ScpB [Candidatus Aenigmarchaeota archaeon]|nr:SMC-Scp complex subunit ScpB [Candidatus Aenigmarchaeota archaeon]